MFVIKRSAKLISIGLVLAFFQSTTAQAGVPDSSIKRITPEGRVFLQPVWSPMGEWIAMTGPRYQGIWLVRADGAELHQLTDDLAVGYKMKWSPDGRRIVGRVAKFEKRRRYNAVKVYDIATKEEIVLSDFRTLMTGLPQWAGSSHRVALLADRGVEFFEIKISQKKSFSEHALAFAGQEGLFVGKTTESIAQPIRPVDGYVVNASLSPNESKIVFEMSEGNLYVCNLNGNELIDLGRGERPRWSPDGERIAFMISTDDGHRIINADIHLIQSDGSGKVNLTNTLDRIEMNCTWSPDGKRLAFDERNSGAVWVRRLAS